MEKKRSNFTGSIGFVLAAAGSAVGLGMQPLRKVISKLKLRASYGHRDDVSFAGRCR